MLADYGEASPLRTDEAWDVSLYELLAIRLLHACSHPAWHHYRPHGASVLAVRSVAAAAAAAADAPAAAATAPGVSAATAAAAPSPIIPNDGLEGLDGGIPSEIPVPVAPKARIPNGAEKQPARKIPQDFPSCRRHY